MRVAEFFADTKFFFKTLISEIQDDQVATGGAALAFYLTLAILPALISCIALLAYMPIEGIEELIFANIKRYMPGEIGLLLREVLNEAISNKKPGLISTGFVGALWATSSGMGATINQLNVVYDISEQRSLFKHRLLSIGMTIVYLMAVIIASSIIVVAQNSEYSF